MHSAIISYMIFIYRTENVAKKDFYSLMLELKLR